MGISYAKKSANQQIQSDSIISSNLPSRRCLSLNDERMEPFTLIWLDESAQENSLDSLRTQTLFREINNDICLFFDEPDQFLSDIERMITERKKLLVVMSGSFAKEVLPKIKFDSISTIIIFCGNYNKYASLKMKYSNVVDICTEHEKLKSCIQNELISLKFNLFTNQILKSVRPLASSNAVENSGAHFSYMSFIELLKQMPQTEQAKDIMLNKCQDYYRGNKSEMKLIETFRNTYTSDKAIDWYTRDSFVYRLVNRAFRTEDVTLWYLFRYYVSDLCTQLESVHKEQNIKTRLTLYRGQPQMPVHELENLKSNLGCLVSINGFCSSSIDIGIAKQFIIDVKDTENFKVVIFEITVDGSSLHNTIFVDIDRYTGTAGESEVLFNIGSVFKIESVNHDSDLGAWIIKMNATDEGTHEIKRKIEAKKKEVHKGNLNLMFGRLLIDINEYAKAESYFQMMLQVLPTYHEDVPLVYDHIGDLSMKTTNWNEAFINYNLAYKIKKKALPSNHPVIGVTLNNIGNYFKAIGDYVQALEYYTKALQCTNDPSSIARTQLNIGAIYGKIESVTKRLVYASKHVTLCNKFLHVRMMKLFIIKELLETFI
jgi:predicted negative regulator of RcsB-dependent stress response